MRGCAGICVHAWFSVLLVALDGSGTFLQVWMQQFVLAARGGIPFCFSNQRFAAPNSSTLLVAVLLRRPLPHSPICASYILAAQTMSFVFQELSFELVVVVVVSFLALY